MDDEIQTIPVKHSLDNSWLVDLPQKQNEAPDAFALQVLLFDSIDQQRDKLFAVVAFKDPFQVDDTDIQPLVDVVIIVVKIFVVVLELVLSLLLGNEELLERLLLIL